MSRTLHFRATEYVGDLRQSAHAHDHLQISMVLRGLVRESVHNESITVGALAVGVKDAGMRHADDFGAERVAIAQLAVPSGTFRELIDDDDRARDWHWSHDTVPARPFLRIVARAARGATTFASDDTDIVDLLAAITARRMPATGGVPPRWLAQAVDELRATWQSGTRVSDVATRVGVHPVYLARCFRRWYGHGVSDELRNLRVRAATNAIVANRATISTVAHASGYADESHLNREFRALSGLAPGQFRQALTQLPFRAVSASGVARIQVQAVLAQHTSV